MSREWRKQRPKKGLIPVTGHILGHEAHNAYVQEVWPAPVRCGNVFCVSEDWLGCQRSPLPNVTLAKGSTGTTYVSLTLRLTQLR